jgi:hypothetical protein
MSNGTYGPITITQPTESQTVSSPVTISGRCQQADNTVTVTVSNGTTTTTVVTASGTNWSTGGISLGSKPPKYTALAREAGIANSDTKHFFVS